MIKCIQILMNTNMNTNTPGMTGFQHEQLVEILETIRHREIRRKVWTFGALENQGIVTLKNV